MVLVKFPEKFGNFIGLIRRYQIEVLPKEEQEEESFVGSKDSRTVLREPAHHSLGREDDVMGISDQSVGEV